MLSDTLTSCKTPTTNTPASLYTPGTFTIAPLDVLDDIHLSPTARLLWLILQSYIYTQGAAYCWPSKATLAARLGVSVRRIYDLLRELEAHEVITITTRSAEGRTNVYHLHPRPVKGGMQKTSTPPWQKTSTELDQGEVDQEEEKDTQKGANAPVCVTYPTNPSSVDTLISDLETSATAREDQSQFVVGYVARSPRQKRGRSAHRRGQPAAPATPQAAPDGAGQPAMSQTSQHTHAAKAAPLAPAQTVQDAIQTEIARQLAEYGVWPKRAALLAAQARNAGRSLDDIRAMHDSTRTAKDPAALLATMIANNAAPPRPRHQDDPAEATHKKYLSGAYAHIFNRDVGEQHRRSNTQ